MIENLLNQKINEKEKQLEEAIENEAKAKYLNEIKEIHDFAIVLGIKARALGKQIEKDSNGMLKAAFETGTHYRTGYLAELPENMTKAMESDFIAIQHNSIPQIENINKEKDDYLLNLKIGMASLADVKPLLDKIDQIKP